MSRRLGWLLAAEVLTSCGKASPPAQPVPSRDSTITPVAPPPASPPINAPPSPLRAPVRLAFVGDLNLGTLSLRKGIPRNAGRGLLAAAQPALAGDLVVGNFEGAVGDSGVTSKCGTTPRLVGDRAMRDSLARPEAPPRRRRTRPRSRPAAGPGCYAFLTPADLTPRLAEAGFTHLNLANNHSNDFGPTGRASTDSAFAALGIALYGPLDRIAIDTVRRGDSLTIVGLIGFATYPFAYDLLDIDRSREVVDSVRPMVDLLFVTFHGGAEGRGALHTPQVAESLGHEPRGDLRRWAHAVIDAGADAVIGHGPHVLRGVEFYRGMPVVYSLGNFLTYGGFNLEEPLGLTAVLQLAYGADRRRVSARLVPMIQRPRAGPRPDPSRGALRLVRRMSHEDFGAAGARVGPAGDLFPGP